MEICDKQSEQSLIHSPVWFYASLSSLSFFLSLCHFYQQTCLLSLGGRVPSPCLGGVCTSPVDSVIILGVRECVPSFTAAVRVRFQNPRNKDKDDPVYVRESVSQCFIFLSFSPASCSSRELQGKGGGVLVRERQGRE